MEICNEDDKGFSIVRHANDFECLLFYGENENVLYNLYGTSDEENFYLVHITITTNYYQNMFFLRTNAVKLYDPFGQISRCFILNQTIETVMEDTLERVISNLQTFATVIPKDYYILDSIKSNYQNLFDVKDSLTFDALEKLGGKHR